MDQVSVADNVSPITLAQSTQVWALGVLVTIKLFGHQTGGIISSFEDDVPVGLGPPVHYHTREDETWYMLEGELTWIVGEKEHVVSNASVIFIPRGTPHAFRNDSGKKARMLVVYTPAGQEEWFVEVGKPVQDPENPVPPPPPTPEELKKAVQLGVEKYGMIFLPPKHSTRAANDEL